MFQTSKAPTKSCLIRLTLGLLIGGFAIAGTAVADMIESTGEPGSPGATTTVDGRQLPLPPDKHFGGKIERNVTQSTPYWPPRVVPPAPALQRPARFFGARSCRSRSSSRK